MKDTKIQWHPGFVAAMNLEFSLDIDAFSVLEVSIGENKHVIEELIGDENMCQALMEIMEPQLLLREKEGRKEGRKEGIQGTVDTLRDFGHEDSEIKRAIMQRYSLSEEEAGEYL